MIFWIFMFFLMVDRSILRLEPVQISLSFDVLSWINFFQLNTIYGEDEKKNQFLKNFYIHASRKQIPHFNSVIISIGKQTEELLCCLMPDKSHIVLLHKVCVLFLSRWNFELLVHSHQIPMMILLIYRSEIFNCKLEKTTVTQSLIVHFFFNNPYL